MPEYPLLPPSRLPSATQLAADLLARVHGDRLLVLLLLRQTVVLLETTEPED